jgi:VanZ family protein
LSLAQARGIFPGWREGRVVGRRLAYVPAALWAFFIAYLAGASNLPPVPTVTHLDKVAHFGAYFVLGCLLGLGWLAAGRRPGRGWLLLLAMLLGVSDEIRQARRPDRSGEVADWLADAVGAAAGIALVTNWPRRGRRNTGIWENDGQ